MRNRQRSAPRAPRRLLGRGELNSRGRTLRRRRSVGLHAPAAHRGPLLQADNYVARLGAVVGSHDPVLGHEINEPGGAAVTDAQRTLQERNAASTLADHDVHSRLIELVAAARRRSALRGGGLQLHQLRDKLRLGGGHGADHTVDLVVAEVGSLAADQGACARPEEEHVAVAQELIGAHFIEHDAAVGAAGHLEGDSRREVRFDQPGDYVDGRFLRGQNQMDADRPALLGQADDVLFDFLGGGHHQVGHFVGDHHDIGHLPGDGLSLFVAFRPNPLHQLFFAQLVVDAQMAHPGAGEQLVALLHFFHRPGQNRLGLAHVGHDRMHQVRQVFVGAQLDHLRVDHQHANLIRPPRHQHRHDDRIEANALAGAGAAGDQQVRQGGQVDDQRVARHVFAQEQRNPHLLRLADGLLHHFAEAHQLPLGVGDLDADRILSRNRGHDAHARHAQRNRQVVGQARNPAQPQPGFELDLELGNHRAGLDFHHANVKAEVGEGFFQNPGFAANLFFLLLETERFARQEQVGLRQFVLDGVFLHGGCFQCFHYRRMLAVPLGLAIP